MKPNKRDDQTTAFSMLYLHAKMVFKRRTVTIFKCPNYMLKRSHLARCQRIAKEAGALNLTFEFESERFEFKKLD